MPHLARLLPLALLAVFAASAAACSVPVFAYALRRWEHEPHILRTARPEAWRSAADERLNPLHAGLRIEPTTAANGAGVWWAGDRDDVWLPGELDEARLTSLVDSPIRQELCRRLATGESTVWLFLRSGDAAADAADQARVETRLAYLRGVIQLPPQDADDPATQRTLAEAGPALRVAFSVLPIDPADPAEWALVAQLRALATAETRDGPLLAPVYGRARALEATPPTLWDDQRIDDTALFLSGACSCQVKAENPGTDLLMSFDWYSELERATPPAEPEPTPTTSAPAPETVVISPPVAAPTAPAAPSASAVAPRSFQGVIVLAGAAVAVGLIIVLKLSRGQP